MNTDIKNFISRQLDKWTAAGERHAALAATESKELGNGASAQYNPARIVSTGAKVDAGSISRRPCFLCGKHRPAQQDALPWGEYDILVNPYPIFPEHLTIATKAHTPQSLTGRTADMSALARTLPGHTVLFNGARCGASAPDHMHFQACPSEYLPIWNMIPRDTHTGVTAFEPFPGMGAIAIRTDKPEEMERLARKTVEAAGDSMCNVLMRADGDLQCVVIPRKGHRPHDYGSGEGQMMVSPAAIDLAGVFVTPRKEDFDRMDSATAGRIYSEVCLTPGECAAIAAAVSAPENVRVRVGILTGNKITLTLHGGYDLDGDTVSGRFEVTACNVRDEILLRATDTGCRADVEGVTIGVNFHWQRQETQSFKGDMRIVRDGDSIALINEIDIEDYLCSVISSEMSATSSAELLKAHAVISRSWALARIRDKNTGGETRKEQDTGGGLSLTRRHVVWYDHDDHRLFDVCADDHCQRYQGVTRVTTPAVCEAVEATSGQVLTYGGKLCDARFSKCCGGKTETFESCWEDSPKPYLVSVTDDANESTLPDLTSEDESKKWTTSSPDAFCNTSDTGILRQVLNSYDRETNDFYRWETNLSAEKATALINGKSGYDFGEIRDLIPLRRGPSGRITLLRVVGEHLTMDIGKELEIRRILSETHLYSSAFTVDRTPGGFRLRGAGWGHGVGLCQIGAAVMASRGYGYKDILAHYYPGARIDNITDLEDEKA